MSLDAIIISDVHVGSYNCQAKSLVQFFGNINDGILKTRRLIINGDLFDSFDSRLRKWNWYVLSWIRKLSDMMEVVWVQGNHDTKGPAEVVSHLLGVGYHPKKYVFDSGDKRIMVIHGDIYDKFITDHPVMVLMADIIYGFLQWIDRSCYLAKVAKSRSKMYVRCMENVKRQALKYAEKHKCDIAICGHTHQAVEDGNYFNSGCWTELPCTYLTVDDGKVELKTFVGQ